MTSAELENLVDGVKVFVYNEERREYVRSGPYR
jgi:hypothetical protein